YRAWLPKLRAFYEAKFPRAPTESETVYRMTIRAKALDTLRGMLPAATTSNVGIYGTGQAYEQLLLRLRAHPLREARDYADLMLVELRKVIPAFLKRVDAPERGGVWSTYFEDTRRETRDVARRLLEREPARAATTARSVTCSGIDCSPWSGSGSRRGTGPSCPRPSPGRGRRTTGGACWSSRPSCTTRSRRPVRPRWPPMRCRWPIASASTWR